MRSIGKKKKRVRKMLRNWTRRKRGEEEYRNGRKRYRELCEEKRGRRMRGGRERVKKARRENED